MTPEEQDKELRKEVISILRDSKLDIVDDADDIMQLISTDRKRVAVEARLDELNNVRDMDLSLVSHHRVIDRIAELKAQQEEV